MRRILLVLSVAALMGAMMTTAVPAFAATPDAGCPTGFEEETIDFGENSNGVPSADVNGSEEDCTKTLKTDPQNPAWEPEPVITVFKDDTTGGPKK
jgi:hypothetical protein